MAKPPGSGTCSQLPLFPIPTLLPYKYRTVPHAHMSRQATGEQAGRDRTRLESKSRPGWCSAPGSRLSLRRLRCAESERRRPTSRQDTYTIYIMHRYPSYRYADLYIKKNRLMGFLPPSQPSTWMAERPLSLLNKRSSAPGGIRGGSAPVAWAQAQGLITGSL
jgi:hypothetical protein